MSYVVKKSNITLTRGDTFKAQIFIKDKEGNMYTPESGDVIEFGVKKDYDDEKLLIKKEVPIDTMILRINPEDTKSLAFGEYVYDMQLTKANGEVITFITKARLVLSEEVC